MTTRVTPAFPFLSQQMTSLLDHVTKQVNLIRAEKKKLKEKARAAQTAAMGRHKLPFTSEQATVCGGCPTPRHCPLLRVRRQSPRIGFRRKSRS